MMKIKYIVVAKILCRTWIATLSVAMTSHAVVDETPSYTAALAAYAEDNLIGESELARVIIACEQESFANPFLPEEAELDTARWHAYETLEEWINAGRLNPAQVCGWAKKMRSEQADQRKEREETREDTAVAWDEAPPNLLSNVVGGATCIVRADRLAQCWDGNYKEIRVFSDLGPVNSVFSVLSRVHFLVFVKADGTLYAPMLEKYIAQVGVIKSIAFGARHFCVIKADNTLASFRFGALFDIRPDLENVMVKAVSAGGNFCCVITLDSILECWGEGEYGELNVPSDLGAVRYVKAENGAVCAVRIDGSLRCWGDTPLDWKGAPVRSVAFDGWSVCAVLQEGSIKCLGKCGGDECVYPKDLGPVKEISVTGGGSCAILHDDRVRCWDEERREVAIDPDLRVWSGDKR